jgi:Zn-dependent metalloprotease
LKDQVQELKVMRTKAADRGRSSVRFQQVYSGVPVFGGELIVQTDSSHNIISAHSKILPDISVDASPVISPEVAEKTALDIFIKSYQSEYDFDASSLRVSKPELWIYNPLLLGKKEDINYLVWRMQVTPKELLPIREIVLVDAHLGNVVLHFNQNPTALNRLIYDRNNTPTEDSQLPGNLMRSEGGPPSIIEDVNNAYDYAGDTYNFYLNYHGRDSIDNGGMDLISTTRYCLPAIYGYPCPFPNAFWYGDPYYQMVYGDGFASADDVVAHEMTHGVTEHESGLIYLNQSGAINESFSDIWGEFVDLTNGRGKDTATVKWLMGEDIGAIRSMKNPPAYGDPDRIWSTKYYCGTCDNGGVHWNSGVGNKAAFLMTDGGLFNGITVKGLGIDKVAKIFYEVQTNLLFSSGDYQDLANSLWQACWDFVGTDGITISDCNQVANAINATEMNHDAPANQVLNPGFEDGVVNWIQSSPGIITDSSGYYACDYWLAWLGGYDYAVEYIYQDVTIPSDATQAYFQFLYGIVTYEGRTVAYDKMAVEVRRPSDDTLIKTLVTLSNRNASAYWRQTARYDLLAYKGQTIRLRFYVTNDYSLPTSFLVDDVVLAVGAKDMPAVASFKINKGAVSTAKQTVTLNNVARTSPTHYLASEDPDFSDATWQPYSTAPSFFLSGGKGEKTVYFKVMNGFHESLVLNDTILALEPIMTSLKINAGAATTTKREVKLNNVAKNSPTEYMASESDTFAGATWLPYSTAPIFTLSTGTGTKTVYFKVRNGFEQSGVTSDTISAPPPVVNSLKINAGAASTTNPIVKLNNTATNAPTHYMASEDINFVGATWQTYSAAPIFTLSAGPGIKTVHFKVKNGFEVEESDPKSDTIELK